MHGYEDIMDELPDPIFILSLPRSGSTLLQRLLSGHPEIATVPEPNVMLYPALALVEGHKYNLVGHDDYFGRAFHDFAQKLPGGESDYWHELGLLARRLYAKSMPSPTKYFLDKSPYYSYIASSLFKAFDRAKYVFLWRHPLSVVSSFLNFPVKGGDVGRWTLYYAPVIYEGLACLIDAYLDNEDQAYSLRYEDLVADTGSILSGLLTYFELPERDNLMAILPEAQFSGKLGDPHAVKLGDPHAVMEDYQVVRRDLTEKWKSTFCNSLRQRWARQYLHWIGRERLSIMGYDLEEILGELDTVPASNRLLRKDSYWMTYGFFYRLFNGRILRDNLRKLQNGEPFWAYR